MKHNIIINEIKESGWQIGTVDGVEFCAKVYDTPSHNGINNGCISKLTVQGIANFDRGWDVAPKTKQEKTIVKAIVGYFA